MMNIHARRMTLDEVRETSVPILEDRFSAFGFGNAEIAEDESFDGAPVFRIDAEVERKVPAEIIVDTLDAIHASLRAVGEDRIVFLTTKRPPVDTPADPDEDVD